MFIKIAAVVGLVSSGLIITTFADSHRARENYKNLAREAGYLCGKQYSYNHCLIECSDFGDLYRRNCEYGLMLREGDK